MDTAIYERKAERMSNFYLIDNPPRAKQFREHRKGNPSGAIVIHTAENKPGVGAAARVAKFISFRSTPGSYHVIVDQTSIIDLMPFSYQAFGEGTGGNRWAIHVSVACRAQDWQAFNSAQTNAYLQNLALACRRAYLYMYENHGIQIPAETITPQEYRTQNPGFIGHGAVDPARRHDPGADFAWSTFLNKYRNAIMQTTTTPEDAMNGVFADLVAAYMSGGRVPKPEEIDAWLPDIQAKVLRGQSLLPTYQWIAHEVANEPKA